MISLDRALLGDGSSGDVAERHQKYADLAGALDIIVFAGSEYERKNISPNFRVIPTRSKKRGHFKNATAIASGLAMQNKYDLLVTQDFAAPAGARIKQALRCPWIVNVHAMFFSSEWLKLNPLSWYLYYLIRQAIRSADAFRVNNQTIRKKLEDWGIGKPVLVQPTPVDITKFKVQNAKVKMTKQNAKLVVLYVGRLSPEKNVEMLIRAVKSLKSDLELEIVGDGPEEARLKRMAEGDRRIKFLGPKSYEELISMYQGADIFVLPSHTESFGKVLIEAGAAGCALVATRTPGAVSIIDDGESGILVEVDDQKSLERALKKLLRDKIFREKLSRAASEMAQKYDAEEAIVNTINFWHDIVNRDSSIQ